ncbi:MAG TPA: c-type cytochrome [Sandaracinaceae bacterium LLY-WYZ-13_1]|nr:c-type cytochrome [Sandaracinaceae bacterium LLY-WYZ-13_1]
MHRAAWVVALALAAGCSEPPASFAARSSTIVRADDGSLWLTSPDDDALVQVDPASLEERARVVIEGAPTQVAIVDGAMLVTLARASELAWVIDGAVERVPVPCGGTRAAVADGRGGALVSCPHDDLVLRVTRDGVDWELPSPGRPTALAVLDARFAVTASRTGRLRVHALDDRRALSDVALAPTPGFAASQVDAVAFDPGRRDFVAAYQRVDHDSDRTRPPGEGGYGSVIDGAPRIEPRLAGPCAERYARFDGGARVFSGPSAAAAAGGVLWVANRTTDDVVALRCEREGDGLAPRLATFTVGRGPRGIVLREDGRVAWVDVGFAHAVARLELDEAMRGPEGPVVEAARERTRALGETRLSRAAMEGRSLFFDADDTHLTPSGIVTCGTCHPAGGEDGLTWFLHTENVPAKLRRTPPAWAARAGLGPFHWDGEFEDASVLARTTIRELMEGDGLFVDTDAMAAWMAEAPIPPGRPVRGEADRARVERGRALFGESGCAGCHAGPLLADGEAHAVVTPSADEPARMAAVQTPTLRAVRARPPYLHDGRAPTLRSVLTEHAVDDRHGETSHLSDADVDALVAYLETL